MKNNLQQLLPDSLKDVKLSRHLPPPTRDAKQLPYGSLDAGQFEKFCCEILNKTIRFDETESQIVKIEPLSGNGHKQYGADIFVERKNDQEAWVELFEVKRVEKFDRSTFRKSLERFRINREKWKYNIKKFVVISSQTLDANLIIDLKSQLDQHPIPGVTVDIWTATTLDRLLEGCKSLVFKYFHPAWTETLFGEKTREHFERYGIYEFDESASWANYDGPTEVEIGDAVIIQNDHVRIYGFLPTLSQDIASCLVELRNGRFSHVLMTLNHRDLVARYFKNPGAPIDNNLRGFLLPYHGENSMWFCDIGNCRLKISTPEAVDFCRAFDRYSAHYMKRLQARERAWRSEEFSIFPGVGSTVPLMTIKRGLWRVLLKFAEAHDVLETNSEWSIFESSGTAYLKVMTSKPDSRYDPGFHVFIRPREANHIYRSFLHSDNDVLLTWCPPQDIGLNQFDGKIGPRYYWDVATTYDWMTREFIPTALKWDQSNQKRQKRWRIFKNKKHENNFNTDEYIQSYRREKHENIDTIETLDQLCDATRRLQSFFSSQSNSIYISKENYKLALTALSCVFEYSSYDNFKYLHGNLSYLENVSDMPSLTRATIEHAHSYNDYCSNNFRMDCLFRCFDVVLESGTCRLNAVEIQEVAKMLNPLLQLMRQTKLLSRQEIRLATH
ncbi:hypothetical protein [Burkholderia cepacia]|uniref:hypothetical protein n=1 Tax=Burkholderia cepacia TaxID=292 RepID=UPI000A8E657C|nr:hypothetical protein [Burkholderia cepacia]MCA7931232.1 hypothetical protein [Burkholderia cepacia]HDR9501655.1 hypothetical protein [Burkholderia cepacia]